MKYNCSDEFNLETIYKKLTSGHATHMVPAKNFFTRENELSLLQNKMNKLMSLRIAKVRRYIR